MKREPVLLCCTLLRRHGGGFDVYDNRREVPYYPGLSGPPEGCFGSEALRPTDRLSLASAKI